MDQNDRSHHSSSNHFLDTHIYRDNHHESLRIKRLPYHDNSPQTTFDGNIRNIRDIHNCRREHHKILTNSLKLQILPEDNFFINSNNLSELFIYEQVKGKPGAARPRARLIIGMTTFLGLSGICKYRTPYNLALYSGCECA